MQTVTDMEAQIENKILFGKYIGYLLKCHENLRYASTGFIHLVNFL